MLPVNIHKLPLKRAYTVYCPVNALLDSLNVQTVFHIFSQARCPSEIWQNYKKGDDTAFVVASTNLQCVTVAVNVFFVVVYSM